MPKHLLLQFRMASCFLLLVGAARSAAAANGAEQEFGLVAMVNLAPSAEGSDRWLVTSFSAQTGTAGFPGTSFESRAVLTRIGGLVNPPKLSLPLPLGGLLAALGGLDSEREWRRVADFVPRAGFQSVLLIYRVRPRDFRVRLHVLGEDVAAGATDLKLENVPGVIATYRAPAGYPAGALSDAAGLAAHAAMFVAREQGLVPGGFPGDTDGIRRGLQEKFMLGAVPGVAADYGVEVLDGRASALVVRPIFVPRAIVIELEAWIVLEAEHPGLVADELRAKRQRREKEIRAKLDGILPAGPALVTPATVDAWRATALGTRYELRPLRYEEDTLVLSATDFTSKQDYVFKAGAAYGATDGLQATGSAHVLSEKSWRLEAGVDGSYGATAESLDATMRWAPQQVTGWALNLEASGGSRRNSDARFGSAAGDAPVKWRRWATSVALSAKRAAAKPVAGEWRAGVSMGLQLSHSDDAFATTAPLAADAGLPDSRAELKAEARAATLLRGGGARIDVGTRISLVQGIAELGGNYDYRRNEVQVSGEVVAGAAGGLTWKLGSTLRAGRLTGAAPLSSLFRAGGDEGWIRGLHEGELAGRAYEAVAVSIGPEVSSWLGSGVPGRAPIFLLAFHDWGRVQEESGARRTARGFGLAVELADLPLGDFSATLRLGYAYSPESVTDRSGAVFVRIDLPFVN